MKKLLFLLFTFYFLLIPNPFTLTPVFAHGAGFPPFFKVNGVIAGANPFQIGGVTPSAFAVPQGIVSNAYLINQPIDFEIDTKILETVFPKEVLDKTTFNWDFGDNQSGTGAKNTHNYKKGGSYIITIIADYHSSLPPQLIESVQLNIIPNKDYKVPQAVIKINDRTAKEPLSENFSLDLNKRINFDASGSKASSPIVEYLWDFDDGKKSNQSVISYRYKLPQYYATPALRIKDQNGFFAYTFVDINNSGKNDPNNPDLEDLKDQILPIIISVMVVLIIGGFILIKLKKKKMN